MTLPSPTERRASCWMSRRLDELGWKASIRLEEGIASTYSWFRANMPNAPMPPPPLLWHDSLRWPTRPTIVCCEFSRP